MPIFTQLATRMSHIMRDSVWKHLPASFYKIAFMAATCITGMHTGFSQCNSFTAAGVSTYTVPAGITGLRITAHGADGGFNGSGGNNNGNGGSGATLGATFNVQAGDVIHLYIGSVGGYVNTWGGGGGGATGVVITRGSNNYLLLVAGAGGGCGSLGGSGGRSVTTIAAAGGASVDAYGIGGGGYGVGSSGTSDATGAGGAGVIQATGALPASVAAGATTYSPGLGGSGGAGFGAGGCSVTASGGGGGGYAGGDGDNIGGGGGQGGTSWFNNTAPFSGTLVLQQDGVAGNYTGAPSVTGSTNSNGKVDIQTTNNGTYTTIWRGTQSVSTALDANWCGYLPNATTHITISTGTTYAPVIAAANTLNCQDITVNAGAIVTVTGTLQVTGNISGSGAITAGAGTIVMNGTNAQTMAPIFTNNTIQNLTINNGAGVTLNGALAITGLLNPLNGTFTTNNNLTLISNVGGTAQVTVGTESGGYITGNVTVQRYIPGGSRKYRFLGHPFSTAMPLTQLTDDIDITGTITGSNANNFTATGSNAASAFYYNEAGDDGATGTNNNAGWAAYTSDNSVSTVGVGQGIRVLVRGSKGQAGSLTGGTYTPDPVTITMSGPLQQGTTVQNLSYTNSSKGWNLVSNPFACNVDWLNVTRINVNNAVYTYRPALSSGNYASYVNGSASNGGSHYLEAGSSFFVKAAGSGPTLFWFEAGKVSSTPANSVFGMQTIHNRVSLTLINDSTLNTDEVVVRFGDDPATDVYDGAYDAENLAGAAQDLYVLDTVGTQYSIFHGSALGFIGTEHREVKLGIGNLTAGSYTLNAVTLNAFTGGNIAYIKDAEQNTLTAISDTTACHFTVTTNTADLRSRFSIVFNAKPAVITVPGTTAFSVLTWPNPATDVITIKYDGLNNNEPTGIRIVDINGRTIHAIELGKQTAGSQRINIKSWSKGMYSVQLLNGNNKQVQSIIKQ
ncbi:hypothetical protein F5148DRAFT_1292477 [Russula earlei]|uniref:Uncharacterized protein n=1 Tax=Russula earlei TaxID=71964 RepID=A0ACC0TUU6_9AGAM|nr:hypothetical protein F5148DRAFT_1292477 [Russula earlei]